MATLALTPLTVPAAAAADAGPVLKNIGNDEIDFLDDEYCFGSSNWSMCQFDQEGAGTFARVVRDRSRAANRDGSLRLATPSRKGRLALDTSVHTPAALTDLHGGNLSFDVRVVRKQGPRFSMGVDCTPDERGGGMSMAYAGPMPGPGEGWRRVDLVQGGTSLWRVSASDEPVTFEEVRATCPDGEVGGYHFSLGFGDAAPGANSRIDDVRVGDNRTNFWVPPLTRASGGRVKGWPRGHAERQRALELAKRHFAVPGYTENPGRLRRPVARGAVIAPQGDRATTLVASPLAAAVRGPLLVNPRGELDIATSNALSVVAGDGPVFLVGNQKQLSRKVARDVRRRGLRVVRLGGGTRYVTAVKVARAIDRRRPKRVDQTLLLASVKQQPQTLSAAAAAGARRGAVLLTRGKQLPPATRRYLSRHRSSRVFAVGQQAAAAVRLPGRREITGPHRYATAVKVANRLFPKPRTIRFAPGARPVDALLAGAYGGLKRGPLLLVGRHAIPAGVRRYVRGHRETLRASMLVAGDRDVTPKVFSRLKRRLPAG